VISFRLQEYARRELAAMRQTWGDDEIRDLVTVPVRYQRWLERESANDPGYRRRVHAAILYRATILALMEIE
jgi:hypothetical protein